MMEIEKQLLQLEGLKHWSVCFISCYLSLYCLVARLFFILTDSCYAIEFDI